MASFVVEYVFQFGVCVALETPRDLELSVNISIITYGVRDAAELHGGWMVHDIGGAQAGRSIVQQILGTVVTPPTCKDQ